LKNLHVERRQASLNSGRERLRGSFVRFDRNSLQDTVLDGHFHDAPRGSSRFPSKMMGNLSEAGLLRPTNQGHDFILGVCLRPTGWAVSPAGSARWTHVPRPPKFIPLSSRGSLERGRLCHRATGHQTVPCILLKQQIPQQPRHVGDKQRRLALGNAMSLRTSAGAPSVP